MLKKLLSFGLFALVTSASLAPFTARAQVSQEGYDDYGSFSSEPVDLDNEVSSLFGRYFQTSFQLGTGVLTGGLGKAYPAGLYVGMRFIFFFDKMWAAELGAGFARHNNGFYSPANTGLDAIDLTMVMNVIPLYLGLRYGFDQDRLSRGLSTMNPYLALGGEFIMKSEIPQGTPNVDELSASQKEFYGQGGAKGTEAFGISMGGGIEFDVYKKRLFMGVDLRYHLCFWTNANEMFGNLSRNGNYITMAMTATYNY